MANRLQGFLRKFVPGIKKADEERKGFERSGKHFNTVKGAVVELRKLKKRLLPADLQKKTPAEFTKIMRGFNSHSRVSRLKDIIGSYKTEQRLK